MRTQALTRTGAIDAELVPESTGLARQQGSGIVRAVPTEDLTEAITTYREIQAALDRALPDCMMTIQGRSFRKKNYWRAVCTAFNLTVECVEERWEEIDGDRVMLVMYRATAPNGRSAYGDGACSSAEKAGKQRTIHNVRSHAHTRGYNRAVSNLVGFGEVSAEEAERDEDRAPERPEPLALADVRGWIRWAMRDNHWTADEVGGLLRGMGSTDGKVDGLDPHARRDLVARLRVPRQAPAGDMAPADHGEE